ncbi:hypothetical protein A1O7_07101 [Cladophialophora yegresii CBS 114405]|uniref:Uncharacterized protein n=1 Tax=Cladophialophora yegresii CBS 114405 TaxID=1182544 RepID=W9VM34_9EURO|nr:uncharacterized protein A1O7_07101 [Cladophialophora yegresii CBS 114405]EXJ56757.1 hypothetical protein A1O7_07101 [Cladophialophora yegresii CBS 114405]
MRPVLPTASKNPGQAATNLVDLFEERNIDQGAKHNRGTTIGEPTTDTRATAQHHTRNLSRPVQNQRHVALSDEDIGDRSPRILKWSDKLADFDSLLLESGMVEATVAAELKIEVNVVVIRLNAAHLPPGANKLQGRAILKLAGTEGNQTRLPAGIVGVTKSTHALRRELLSVGGVGDSREDGHTAVYAPSPPPARTSSLGYMSEGDYGEPQHHEARPQKSRRQRSRTQAYEEEESQVEVLRPGDELTVIERHEPTHGDYE